MKIAVIDTEGITVGLGGSRKYKKSTCWISEVALVVYNTKIWTIDVSLRHKIRMPIPYWKTCRKTKNQWNFAQKFGNKKWNTRDGLCYKESLKIIEEVLKTCDEVWAKGKVLENRFLNDIGMYGTPVVYRDRIPSDIKIFVQELNGIIKKTFDAAMYEYYSLLASEKGVTFRAGSFAANVMDNYPKGLPCPHDPTRECEYFLSELLRHRARGSKIIL
jgi:hypothetical protein